MGLAVAAADSMVRAESTHGALEETLRIVKKIQADLGIADAPAPKYSADDNYPNWTPAHKSLCAKYLTREVYRELAHKKTPLGFTLDAAIQPAIDMPHAPHVSIGVSAGDADSYEVFAPLFDKVIEDYHSYPKDRSHPTDLDYTKLRVPDLDAKYILSTRIRGGRSVAGLPLPPLASRAARRETERLISTALNGLTGDLKGKYYPLNGMTDADNDRLVHDHFLFENPGPYEMEAGFGRDWPDNRGIFHNDSKTFLVWVNEEDHMRIISMQKGADVTQVFRRFVDACNAVEASLKANNASFAHSKHLGYITTCPTNLGTGLRASVHAKLPLLGKVPGFQNYAKSLGLQIRNQGGERDTTYSGVFDVSNRHRLGYSEVELVQKMLDGLEHLIALEKKLEAGETVTF